MMVLATHNDIKLIKRGNLFTISYRTGARTVPCKLWANRIFNAMCASNPR